MSNLIERYTSQQIIQENASDKEIFDIPFYISNNSSRKKVSFAINVTNINDKLIPSLEIEPCFVDKKEFYKTIFKRKKLNIIKGDVMPNPLKIYEKSLNVPPVLLFQLPFEKNTYYLVDGNHRIYDKAFSLYQKIPTYILNTNTINNYAKDIFLSEFDQCAFELMHQLSNKNRSQSI